MMLKVDVKKKYGKFSLDVDFEENGRLGLLGESGSGKTLLLKCIAGIEKPDSGKIILNGKVFFDSEKKINLPPSERKVGYIFQNYALFPNMTVSENIMAGIKGEKVEKEKLLKDALLFFGLEKVRDSFPRYISGGEAQRCAIARIAVRKPDLILLDEPFSALDSFIKYNIEAELFDILDELKVPVIFVSHDKNEIYRRCERVCVLDNGKGLGVKDSESFYKKPEYVSEAKLVGIRNFFKAEKLSQGKIYIPELNMEVYSEEDCDFIGISEKDIRFSNKEDEFKNRAYVKSAVKDVDKIFFTLNMEGKNIFMESSLGVSISKGEEIYFSVDLRKILFLKGNL